MNELQVRRALLSQGEILSLKYSGIGSITISLVSTKHWVAEIGLSKLQLMAARKHEIFHQTTYK